MRLIATIPFKTMKTKVIFSGIVALLCLASCNTKKKEEKRVSTYPLERDEIEKFRLVGIIGDHIQRLAIVEIMDEGKLKFYPLLKGTHIGLHNGRVVEIMADRVIIEEHGKSKTRRIILKLHKENEVKP